MNKTLVGIVMGSDSDLSVMSQAQAVLEHFGVSCEVTIVSAHRTPDAMAQYAKDAQGRGTRVIIAGAGGSAHLPGMLASLTPLPVIGVPIAGKSLEGMDSLLSIVQMPPGVPVATVAINGAKNAGILAAQILSITDPELQEKISAYKKELSNEVGEKNELLAAVGVKKYLQDKEI